MTDYLSAPILLSFALAIGLASGDADAAPRRTHKQKPKPIPEKIVTADDIRRTENLKRNMAGCQIERLPPLKVGWGTPSVLSGIFKDEGNGSLIFKPENQPKSQNAVIDRRPLGSIIKLLTAYLVFEDIRSGRISPETHIPIKSQHFCLDQSRFAIEVFDEDRKTETVKVLLASMLQDSNNVSAEILADFICGSSKACVDRMNELVRKWGATQTTIRNVSGIPTPKRDDATTAEDLTLINRHLAKFHDDFERYQKEPIPALLQVKHGQKYYQLKQAMDEAGFIYKTATTSLCYSFTAWKRFDNTFYSKTVMCAPSKEERFEQMIDLSRHSFGAGEKLNQIVSNVNPPFNAIK